MQTQLNIVCCVVSLLFSSSAGAGIIVPLKLVDAAGAGEVAGLVEINESAYGVVLTPDLRGLTPGLHGFHLHQNPSCAVGQKDGKPVAGLGAGGHYDPAETNQHGAPWGDGHLGDLPPLFVDNQGHATVPVLAPRLKLSDIHGRALMIHAAGDNYSDQPQKLGGGGARVACGVID